jgi:5-methylcytosine-specific restriction endonuclease McrA
MALFGKDIPDYVIKNYLRNPEKTERILVTMNNLKFLKDMEKKGDLYCAYCNKGPLIIYDINPEDESVVNKNYKYKPFNPIDGATCDHKVPQSKGGDKFNYSNLAVCCNSCNKKKSNMSYDDWMKTIS